MSDSPALPAVFVDGVWRDGAGPVMVAEDPVTGAVVWSGGAAAAGDVADAIKSARGAFAGWANRAFAERARLVSDYAAALDGARDELVDAIVCDTGKPRWEAKGEVTAMIRKVSISIDAHQVRTGEARKPSSTGTATVIRHRPLGVMAVLGPFNFPGHLPNGHIVPALLAGNTVVFKPSEQAPLTGAALVQCAQSAGLPVGVLNLVQGARDTGEALARHPGIDGLLFTGSVDTGRLLHRALVDRPETLLALEMGGNNPIVVWQVADVEAAAWLVVLSAYLTAGQRCTCARRLILPVGDEGQDLLDRVAARIDRIRVGPPDADPEPFMGPVINNATAESLLAAQNDLLAAGGVALRPMQRPVAGRPFLTPGLIDVSAVSGRVDEERFGPLLQVIRVPTFDAAIVEANATRFGLAAALLSDNPDHWSRFVREVRAGVLNWNRPTAGAPSDAPFGGIGASGNHRPSALYAADYCAYPVTSVEDPHLRKPDPLPRGIDD